MLPPNECRIVNMYEEANAVFDCSWNENDPNLIMEAIGDGRIKAINTANNSCVFEMQVHLKEVYSIENCHKNPVFLFEKILNFSLFT